MTSHPYLTEMCGRATDEQLCLEFGGALPPSVIYATLAGAEHDLTGQIAPEAWDEMVYRLAQYRLDQIVSEDAQP